MSLVFPLFGGRCPHPETDETEGQQPAQLAAPFHRGRVARVEGVDAASSAAWARRRRPMPFHPRAPRTFVWTWPRSRSASPSVFIVPCGSPAAEAHAVQLSKRSFEVVADILFFRNPDDEQAVGLRPHPVAADFRDDRGDRRQ
jgi:hypothetical protein